MRILSLLCFLCVGIFLEYRYDVVEKLPDMSSSFMDRASNLRDTASESGSRFKDLLNEK